MKSKWETYQTGVGATKRLAEFILYGASRSQVKQMFGGLLPARDLNLTYDLLSAEAHQRHRVPSLGGRKPGRKYISRMRDVSRAALATLLSHYSLAQQEGFDAFEAAAASWRIHLSWLQHGDRAAITADLSFEIFLTAIDLVIAGRLSLIECGFCHAANLAVDESKGRCTGCGRSLALHSTPIKSVLSCKQTLAQSRFTASFALAA